MTPPAAPVALEELLASRLMHQRIVVLDQELDDAAARRVCAQLLLLSTEDPAAPIGLYLSSPDGALAAALRVVDLVDAIPNDVATLALGPVLGAAVLVLASGSRGSRCALPGADVTLRSGGAVGLGSGDPRARSEGGDRAGRVLPALLAERTDQPVDVVEGDLSRGRRLDAEEARSYGLVDRVLNDATALAPGRLTVRT